LGTGSDLTVPSMSLLAMIAVSALCPQQKLRLLCGHCHDMSGNCQ